MGRDLNYETPMRSANIPALVAVLPALSLLGACATEPPDEHAWEHPMPVAAAPMMHSSEPIWLPPVPITATCRDGWVSYSDRRRGTCVGHGGVREWVDRPAE